MASEVRLARSDELARAGEIVVEAYRAGGFLENAEVGYAEKLADTAGRASTAELYVALIDGDIVGCVTYCPHGTVWGEIARSDEGEFRMLGVAEAARGRGIGLALTERCLERSRELGYAGVVLSSLPTMTSAHQLYEGLGFRRAPQRDWSPGEGITLWAFELTL